MNYVSSIEVEAYQLTAETRGAIVSALGDTVWCYESNAGSELYVGCDVGKGFPCCARSGDWIVKHPLDGLQVYRDEDFRARYVDAPGDPFKNRPLRGWEYEVTR